MAIQWEHRPIVAWAIDKFDVIEKACEDSNVDLDYELDTYGRYYYNDNIEKIFTTSPFKLNLGGETERLKLSFTDKPIGVFNFSLASRSLYPLSEFYSKDLAEQDPTRFESLGLLSGIVPADMVEKKAIGDKLTFIFRDKLKDKEYLVEKRIKGQTEINNGVPDARLQYASKEKKVYQYIKRKGGKVKYVEIYSLFYYTSLSGNFQYAVRHIPAMMCADYLEKQGVKVRFYMTRFVLASIEDIYPRAVSLTGVDLPMGKPQSFGIKNRYLLVQPIIAKDFQQDFDKRLALLLSSESKTNVYDACASYSVRNDMDLPNRLMRKTTLSSSYIYGDPDWSQEQYWEGVERYRNKYQEYVKLGIFESKEVLPMAMIFFHDQSIASYFNSFSSAIRNLPKYDNFSEVDTFLQPDVNRFFVWWMKTSGNTIKHKINLINSTNFLKDLREIESDLLATQQELSVIVNEATIVDEKNLYDDYGKKVLKRLNIIASSSVSKTNPLGKIDLNLYINSFISELTTFADNGFFPTPEEEVENRLNLKQYVFDELKKV